MLDIVAAGIHVMTAVNIQHLETLSDAAAKVTGVRVRETVPDTFLDRADDVVSAISRTIRTSCPPSAAHAMCRDPSDQKLVPLAAGVS